MERETLRTFKHFPEKLKCPVCKKNTNKECFLIGIVGTEDGCNIQAEAIHNGCLDLVYDKKLNIIYQKL